MELERLIKTQTYRKIMKFFHENPASIDTPRGVATWTNQDVRKVSAALKKLADMGILNAHKAPTAVGYSYTGDKKTVNAIGRLLEKC